MILTENAIHDDACPYVSHDEHGDGTDCECWIDDLYAAVKESEQALTMMVESYERHDEWCGNLATAPGASIHWQSIDAARAALSDTEATG